jgi:hypothetical protein
MNKNYMVCYPMKMDNTLENFNNSNPKFIFSNQTDKIIENYYQDEDTLDKEDEEDRDQKAKEHKIHKMEVHDCESAFWNTRNGYYGPQPEGNQVFFKVPKDYNTSSNPKIDPHPYLRVACDRLQATGHNEPHFP